MHFQELPTVLQDIVCDFAWQTEWEHVRLNMNQLFRIKKFDLPPIFWFPCQISTPLEFSSWALA